MTVRIVGIDGPLSVGSSSELALQVCLAEAARFGASAQLLAAHALVLPPTTRRPCRPPHHWSKHWNRRKRQ